MDATNPLRGSIFGGFNRKDVAAYVEELAKNNAANKEETEALRKRCLELEEQVGNLEAMREAQNSASAQVDELTAQVEKLQQEKLSLEEENRLLQAELEEARQSANAYEQVTERLAAMEIDSAKHAEEIEKAAWDKAGEIEADGQRAVSDISSSLENVRRETLRMKDRLRSQLIALEASVEDLSALSRDKQEYLRRYLPDEQEKA